MAFSSPFVSVSTFALTMCLIVVVVKECLSLQNTERVKLRDKVNRGPEEFNDRVPDDFHGDFGENQFKRFDSDGDGYITMEEGVSHLSENIGMSAQIPLQQRKATMEQIFKALDKDKDGRISEQEFMKHPNVDKKRRMDKVKQFREDL